MHHELRRGAGSTRTPRRGLPSATCAAGRFLFFDLFLRQPCLAHCRSNRHRRMTPGKRCRPSARAPARAGLGARLEHVDDRWQFLQVELHLVGDDPRPPARVGATHMAISSPTWRTLSLASTVLLGLLEAFERWCAARIGFDALRGHQHGENAGREAFLIPLMPRIFACAIGERTKATSSIPGSRILATNSPCPRRKRAIFLPRKAAPLLPSHSRSLTASGGKIEASASKRCAGAQAEMRAQHAARSSRLRASRCRRGSTRRARRGAR